MTKLYSFAEFVRRLETRQTPRRPGMDEVGLQIAVRQLQCRGLPPEEEADEIYKLSLDYFDECERRAIAACAGNETAESIVKLASAATRARTMANHYRALAARAARQHGYAHQNELHKRVADANRFGALASRLEKGAAEAQRKLNAAMADDTA